MIGRYRRIVQESRHQMHGSTNQIHTHFSIHHQVSNWSSLPKTSLIKTSFLAACLLLSYIVALVRSSKIQVSKSSILPEWPYDWEAPSRQCQVCLVVVLFGEATFHFLFEFRAVLRV